MRQQREKMTRNESGAVEEREGRPRKVESHLKGRRRVNSHVREEGGGIVVVLWGRL